MKLWKQEEVDTTDTSAPNTSGVLIDKDEKAHAVLDIGAKRGVFGPLVYGDDVARFTRDGEEGKAEARAPGVAGFAAGKRITLGARDGNDVLTRVGNEFLRGKDTDRGARASDYLGFGGNYSLCLWGGGGN